MAEVCTTKGTWKKILMKDLRGARVRIKHEMRNGMVAVPAGAEGIVTGTWRSGVSVTFDACSHCGVKPRITKIHRDEVLLVEVRDG
jgi:hypothetical protein